tara:strand:- start:505 stop:654 length:150 start_codon:yes stop_codon:yes gene_type:complete
LNIALIVRANRGAPGNRFIIFGTRRIAPYRGTSFDSSIAIGAAALGGSP